jgi:hypothetical protein
MLIHKVLWVTFALSVVIGCIIAAMPARLKWRDSAFFIAMAVALASSLGANLIDLLG